MQVRCGQCGLMLDLDDLPADGTVACPRCGHELYVGYFLGDPGDSPRDESDMSVRFDDEPEHGYADELRRAMEQKIRFTCGKCGKGLKVEKRFSGKRIRCPACKALIRVPYPDEEAKFEFAALPDDVEEVEIHVEVGEAVGQLEDAVDVMATGGKPPRRKSRVSTWTVLVVAVAILWIAGLAYWLVSRTSQGEANTPGPSEVARPIVKAPPQSQPATQPAKRPRTRQVSKPAPVIPAGLVVTGVKASCLAGPRHIPARRRYFYLLVSADVEAGSRPLRLRSFGGDVVFVSKGKEYPSLGLAIPNSSATTSLLRARREVLRIAAGWRRSYTFVFEVPTDTSIGAIRITGVGETSPGNVFPPAVPATDAIAGRYAELPPRTLQPLLRDPVMAAIQNARNHRLVIEKAGRVLRMRISIAGVVGTLIPAGNGYYDAILRSGTHKLKCALRILGDGKTLILYLSDSPFHQIVYRKPAKRR